MSLNSFNSCSDPEQRPLISIITVTYNAIDTINATIQNILDQTYESTEFIIIDGGSSDGTKQIIENNSAKLSCWVCEKDNGIFDAMNKGITRSHGDWVIFMNSGDIFATNTVLEDVFLKNNIKSQVQVLYGNTIVKNSGKILKSSGSINKGYFYFETICHQSIFFRRTAFKTIGHFNTHYKIISDREWLLKASLAKIRFQYLPINICIWDKEGFSANNSAISATESMLLQRSYFNYFERLILPWFMRFKNIKNKFSTISNKG
jgi:glycosyltransferase involved in cell wall biosynthesis